MDKDCETNSRSIQAEVFQMWQKNFTCTLQNKILEKLRIALSFTLHSILHTMPSFESRDLLQSGSEMQLMQFLTQLIIYNVDQTINQRKIFRVAGISFKMRLWMIPEKWKSMWLWYIFFYCSIEHRYKVKGCYGNW